MSVEKKILEELARYNRINKYISEQEEVVPPPPGDVPPPPPAEPEGAIAPPPEGGAEPAGGEPPVPESRKKDFNILVEKNLIEGSKIIDLGYAQQSLGEIEKELEKLLNS
jgi:hypothetical protein